jgi:hypothetical protein
MVNREEAYAALEFTMKTKSLVPAIVALVLSLTACSSTTVPRRDLLGGPAPDTAAERTIKIMPDTRYVYVTGGQVVQFDAGGKTFTWHFDGPDIVWAFDLNRVAPSGMLDHVVTAYISPNPLYAGEASR